MANKRIKQILVGTTTYDIEDASAAKLASNNTFTGSNTFNKGITSKGSILIPFDNAESHHIGIGDYTGISTGGWGAFLSMDSDRNGNLTLYSAANYAAVIRNRTGLDNFTYDLPDKSGTFALTSDIPSTSNFVTLSGAQTISGNKTFTGTNMFKGGTTQFLTSSAGLNDPKTDVGASGIHCQTGGNPGTYYMDGKLTNGTNTLTLPLKTGTVALTSDIPTIEANPAASGTATLTKLKVGSTVYTLPSGGASGGVTSVTTSGSGNAVTSASISGNTLTLTKGSTFLTAHQSLASCAKLSGGNTFSGVQKFNNKVNIISNDGLYVSGPTQVNTLSITMGKILYPASEANIHEYKLPDTGGTLALTSDIDVTAAGNNTFSGTNKFDNIVEIGGTGRPGTPGQGRCELRVSFGLGSTSLPYSDYGPTAISHKHPNSSTLSILSFPNKSGTFALTSDLPDTSLFPTLAGDNVFTGNNVFTGYNSFKNGIYIKPNTGSPELNTFCGIDKTGLLVYTSEGTKTISVPMKEGTLALTNDIPIKTATLSGTTLTLTI